MQLTRNSLLNAFRKYSEPPQTTTLWTFHVFGPQRITRSEYCSDLNALQPVSIQAARVSECAKHRCAMGCHSFRFSSQKLEKVSKRNISP